MLKMLLPLAAAGAAALVALSATAQTGGPTPNEQLGMHTGTQTTNGSAVMVTDRNGTHPEGYPGMAIRNRASADGGQRGHHLYPPRRPASEPQPQ